MATKALIFLALAAMVSQGHSATVVWLQDNTVTHISNPMIALNRGIAHFWFETLVSCNVIFPNGAITELYPTNRLNVATVSYPTGSAFGPGCHISFMNSPPSMSGTYELMSQIEHQDGTQTLTRQRYHITFVMSEVTWPTAGKEAVKVKA